MGKIMLGTNVFDEAVDRMIRVMEEGHRVAVSFSAGKDSGVALEVCLAAAEFSNYYDRYGKLDVVMRDEEIMFPGTFEYAERTAAREEIAFHWLIAGQPITNVYDRNHPYWWVFDDRVDPSDWVRTPPDIAEFIPTLNIETINHPSRFPPHEGKHLMSVIGLRVSESRGRLFGIHSSGGYLTKVKDSHRLCRPIYDWKDGDVWKAIGEGGWDYNKAYDTMYRMGVKRESMRIAPPTLTHHGVGLLEMSARAWPNWFERVAHRLPAVRLAANYGRRAIQPDRRQGETWKETFHRECIDTAPPWIAERAVLARDKVLRSHARHSVGEELPEVKACWSCFNAQIGSWKKLTETLYNGDPLILKSKGLVPLIDPEYFREGAGKWGGTPAFS